jgi:hypothetical protein
LLSDATVTYPIGAVGDATIVLTLTVAADGAVQAVVADSSEEPFASDAVRAARQWRFEPALRDGAPVASKIRFEVVYSAPADERDRGTDGAATAPPAAEAAASPPRAAAAAVARAPAAIEVDVVGEHVEPSRSASLTRAEVREIPGTFGDPFRAIETMPGVTPIVSGLPFFFVRGAPPGDVGYFLDGVRVPLLFHVGIGPSVVHPGLIRSVDLYPGGYPARFGRFSGGIVSGETTEPTPELHGEYNLRLFDAGALVEAPFAAGRGSALAAGRYSYTATLLSALSSDTELDYWDYQARVSYDLTDRDRASVFAFGSYDYLGQRTPTGTETLFGTEFHRIDARYDRRLAGDGKLRLALTGGIDRSRLRDDRFVRDRMVGSRVELAIPLAPSALLRAGTDVQLDTYDVQLNTGDLGPSAARLSSLFPTRTDAVIGTRVDVVVRVEPRLEVTPGLRLDYFVSQGTTAVAVDPRVSARLRVSQRAHLLSAFGVAHQPPAFVVPVPGFQPGGLRGGLQQAVQQSFGIELSLDQDTIATATAFQNGFFDLSDPLSSSPQKVDGCPPGTFPTGSLAGDRGASPVGNAPDCGEPRFEPGTIGPDRTGGGGQGADSRGSRDAARRFEARSSGRAYGLELYVKRKLTGRLGGFVSYTLSRSTRSVGSEEFVATFDRTHVVNAALAYDLGRRWRAGTRVTFYTGLPKAADPTDPETTRLPAFFRLDLRLEKRWQLSRTSWIAIVAEWMNATLSKEAVSTECTLRGCETQTIGPVTIPSIGVEGGF